MTKLPFHLNTVPLVSSVNAGPGLINSGTAADRIISAKYSTSSNIVLSSPSNSLIKTVGVGGNAGVATTITVTDATGILVGSSCFLGSSFVGKVQGISGTTITFVAALAVTVGNSSSVTFDLVLTATSELLFSVEPDPTSITNTHTKLQDIDLALFDYTNLPGSAIFNGMTYCASTPIGGTIGLVPLPGVTTTDVNSNTPVTTGLSKTLNIPNANGAIVAGMIIRSTSTPFTNTVNLSCNKNFRKIMSPLSHSN